jgi:hypothetical protein
VRRATLLLVATSLAACPLPEDTFVVRGVALPGAEVRLLRNKVASKTRCDALEPLEVARADAAGGFSFTMVRQQITGGENERRFFSVEFDQAGVVSQWRFWFPDADLDLGRWESPGATTTEVEADGAIAWRGMPVPSQPFDRRVRQRLVDHAFDWKEVPIDSLGRTDVIRFERRKEFPREERGPLNSTSPPSRLATCPFIDVKPCPLVDGRFLPFQLPPDSRTLVFNFGADQRVNGVLFHGLVLERPAVRVRYDFNFLVDYEQWNRLSTVAIDPIVFDQAAEFCTEPGAFLSVPNPNLVVRPVTFRASFEDADGNLVPVLSLQEMTVR